MRGGKRAGLKQESNDVEEETDGTEEGSSDEATSDEEDSDEEGEDDGQ